MSETSKSGEFEADVSAGYYDQKETVGSEFLPDFKQWLESRGVPKKYINNVSFYAWMHGHAHGFNEILNLSYYLAESFKENEP